MKALVKAQAAPGLTLQDIPEPTIGINDVLIRVLRTGMCGTDLHIYKWDDWAKRTIPVPMAIGHEFVGRVEAEAQTLPISIPVRSSPVRATWSAAAAGTVWLAGAICAPIHKALA